MATSFCVKLLGGFSVISGDVAVDRIRTIRLRSLLAYLILNAGLHQSRQYVAFQLWPDTSESHARNNLRQFLHQLRQALPEPERFLAADATTVCWQQDDHQNVDVWRFEHALAQADIAERAGDQTTLRQTLEKALACYQGDLLPECYDEWIAPVRDDLRRRYRDACRRLVEVLESQQDYARALDAAEALRQLDPLDEDTYALLIRLHTLNHDHASARRVYEAAADTLNRELGMAPGPALHEAYARLQQPIGADVPAAGLARHKNGPLALVGRQHEWQQLQVAWRGVTGGEAHLVLISGEAGIGKSRLAEEVFDWVQHQGLPVAHTRSYEAEGQLSLSPIIEWLRSPALRPRLPTMDGFWLTEIARLLPELLAERADIPAPEPITEAGRRHRFFEALARGVLTTSAPLLLWIDDLQWCDQETLEWLHFLLRFAAHNPLLVLGTARNDQLPPDHPLNMLLRHLWSEERITLLELAPLDAAETAHLASQIAGRDLDDATAIQLYHQTEGNPLFVVETMRAAAAGGPPTAGARPLRGEPGSVETVAGASELPPRVHAVIAGRLAQLSPHAARIAEIGAAIGRAFTLGVLLAVEGGDDQSAIQALDELWQKRILREQSPGLFDFTHDQLREVALARISPAQRRQYHQHIAQALEARNAGDLDTVSAQIAFQYEQSGMVEQAIAYYERAATVASDVYANRDAISLATRALSLLVRLAPGGWRDAQELTLQLILARLYRITKGWASPEEERVMNRAVLLSAKVGDVAQRAQALYGLQSVQVVAAQLDKVEHTYAEMHDLFVQTQGSPPPPFADLMFAGAKLHAGRLSEANEQFEHIVTLRDPVHIKNLQDSQGVNYLSHGHAWNAHALWCLGYPQKAYESAVAGVDFARQYVQPFNQALAVTYLAMLQELRADPATFRHHAEEALRLTHEYEAPYYYAWANILVQFAQAWSNPTAAHLVGLQEAITAFRASGARLRLPYYLSLLARIHRKRGEPAEGLAVIEQALSESLRNNERWWDAELHRLRGELMREQGAAPEDTEAAYQRALEIARAQNAKLLELRAATSLAHLWMSQGRHDDTGQLVAPLYAWFTEGFDTPDLRAARAVIG